jgi:toluene monooxygenase system ferredoxin subunit
MTDWHEVMKADDLWEDEMACATANGTKLLIVNAGGELRAYKAQCPHQMTELTEEDFDPEEKRILCPSHQWEFDALSGDSINPTGEELTRYKVELRDGVIRVLV